MLHTQTVSAQCLQLIKDLMTIPDLSSFRLAGGTALALQKGHRTSVDVDLFAGESFDNAKILQALEAYLYPERPENVRTYPFGFFCTLFEIKTDFMYWGDPYVEEDVVEDGIRMVSPLEIFAMKLQAVTSRKTKKDFIDIALLLQEIPLADALASFQKRYPYDDTAIVLKQLSYFEEAEKDAGPQMLIGLSWSDAKEKIADAIYDYWQQALRGQ